ncbi:MAG TPA: TIGR04282 family arsenosugar biosynthesis glycosyltransferase [Stellaceae bacterium]|nr:TIGR04282 family arsenosugar biosynthesis glycosyltransferase [Stellaceae bacterium]
MHMRRHLVVFLRAPRLGRVKSRLATGIGAMAALRFYRQTSERLLRAMVRDRRWRVHLALTPDRDAMRACPWRFARSRFGQGAGDLGRRMERAVRRLPPGPVVIIGSDIPALTPAHVAAAFAALGTHHAVFGPAADGGYWLVGFRRRPRLPRPLFPRVRWSSPHALADTLVGLPCDMRVKFLETLEDVDDAAAYRRWRATLNRRRRASDAPGGAA